MSEVSGWEPHSPVELESTEISGRGLGIANIDINPHNAAQATVVQSTWKQVS